MKQKRADATNTSLPETTELSVVFFHVKHQNPNIITLLRLIVHKNHVLYQKTFDCSVFLRYITEWAKYLTHFF